VPNALPVQSVTGNRVFALCYLLPLASIFVADTEPPQALGAVLSFALEIILKPYFLEEASPLFL